MVTISREAADAAWRRADEERAFWQAHQREFLERYPDQFVAVKDGAVVAIGADLDELLAGLERRELEPVDVWLHFFNAHPTSTFF
jgi:Family of unknown function (DUF5678)